MSGLKSSVSIVILVFGVLLSTLYASESIRSNATPPPKGFKTRQHISEDAAIDMAMNDLEQKIAPLYLDKYVETQKYLDGPLVLLFVHDNGTVYAIDENTICQPCDPPNCDIIGGKEPVRGCLFYEVNGRWQDSSGGIARPSCMQ